VSQRHEVDEVAQAEARAVEDPVLDLLADAALVEPREGCNLGRGEGWARHSIPCTGYSIRLLVLARKEPAAPAAAAEASAAVAHLDSVPSERSLPQMRPLATRHISTTEVRQRGNTLR